MKKVKIYSTILLCALLAACSSITCPLNNMVRVKFGIYNAAQKVDTLKDTMTISTHRISGMDSVLINKDVYITQFQLRNKEVDYDSKREHFRIYFHPDN